MADLPQKCKKNYKSLEKLSDPESMSNHKRTVAASAPQPPVAVKEEHDDSYTPYNAELQLGLHSELDIKFEPDEQLQGVEEGEHDEVTGYASTIKPEIEEKPSLSAETQPIAFKKMNTGASSSSSKCKSEDCIEETEDNLIVTFKDLLDGENQENIEQGQKCHSSKHSGKGYKVKGHSAARKYICDVCSYITTKKQCIICHLKKHNSKKPYDCNICEKKFRLSSALNRHIRKHKPNSCEFYDKRFSQLQNFNATPRIPELMRLRRDILHSPKILPHDKRRNCAVCLPKGIRKTVSSTCVTCDEYMCYENCWDEWHTSTTLKEKDRRGRKRQRN